MRRITEIAVLISLGVLLPLSVALAEDEVIPVGSEAPVEVVEVVEADEESEEAPEEEGEAEESEAEDAEEAVPESFDEAVDDVSLTLQAIESKNWPVAAGFILMLLVFVGNKFGLKDKVGPKRVPLVALVVALLGTTGAGLAMGVPLWTAVAQGMSAGLAAIGSWEVLFKSLLNKEEAAEE